MTEHPNPFIEHPATYRPCNGGDQWKFRFANGFGASVIRHGFSYGGEDGLWELGVLRQDGHLTYDTRITDDVIGYLTEGDVAALLQQVASLPAPVTATS